MCIFFFFQAEDGIRDYKVTGVQTCALPICAGAVNDFDPQTVPKLSGSLGVRGQGAAQARQNVPRQPDSGLAVGAGAFVHPATVVEGKKCLDLADDLAAGAIRIEHLVEKAKEGAAHRIDPITAVGALVGLGQEPWGQQRTQEQIQVQEALLAQVLDALAQGSQPRPPDGKEWRMHVQYYYWTTLDEQAKMSWM